MTSRQIQNNWKLIRTLREGSYGQVRGVLRKEWDQFCVLGVACDLINSRDWKEVDGPENEVVYRFRNSESALPKPIWDTAYGWPGEEGPTVDGETILWHNDENYKTFPELADMLAEWLKEEIY